MKQFKIGVLTLVALGIVPLSSAAAERGAMEKRVIDELVPKFVATIAHLGRGEADKARAVFQSLSPVMRTTGETTAGPFSDRAQWHASFVALVKTRPDFENVELVGVQHVSSQCFKVSLVAHARFGPVLLQCRVFAHRGKLYAVNLHFDTNWIRVEQQIATIKDRLSTVYPIAAAKSAGKAKTRSAGTSVDR